MEAQRSSPWSGELIDFLPAIVRVYRRDLGLFLETQILFQLPGIAVYASGSPLALPFRVFVDYTLVWLLSTAVTVLIAAQICRSGEAHLRTTLSTARARLPALLKLTVAGVLLWPLWIVLDLFVSAARNPLTSATVILGVFAILALLARWSLFLPAILLEPPQRLRRALGRSRALVGDAWLPAAAQLVLLAIVWAVLPMAVAPLATASVDWLFGAGALDAATARLPEMRLLLGLISMPVWGIGLTLAYYERLARMPATGLAPADEPTV